jgi:hypothetical protein
MILCKRFGSEMAWDSTGQEGVYYWSRFFNDTNNTAINALNSILAYEPLIPHWGYNGNARRYWYNSLYLSGCRRLIRYLNRDNIYGGKLMRIERQLHHYGSGLNSLPVISAFMSPPTPSTTFIPDYYLLRLGFGGLSGPLSNIDSGGFAAASFHSFADTLKWDGYSGDYGPNFSGHSMGMGTFIVQHPTFGWQAFGGNVVVSSSGIVTVTTRDSVRRRVFIAPFAAQLILDAGAFETVQIDPTNKLVTVTILSAPSGSTAAAKAPVGRLLVKQTATVTGVKVLTPTSALTVDSGGAFSVSFNSTGGATVMLSGA